MESKEGISGQKERIAGRLLLHMVDLLSEKGLLSEGEKISIKKMMIQQRGWRSGTGRDL